MRIEFKSTTMKRAKLSQMANEHKQGDGSKQDVSVHFNGGWIIGKLNKEPYHDTYELYGNCSQLNFKLRHVSDVNMEESIITVKL